MTHPVIPGPQPAFEPRLFADDYDVRRVGGGLLAHWLPKSEWTHEAHIAAFTWIIVERPDIDLDRDVRELISSYNVAAGGVNTATTGYHETITRCFLAGIRSHLPRTAGWQLAQRVNALLKSPEGRRDWPLRFYSRDRLFSVEARRDHIAPDIQPLP